jgi:hypothetical protein
VAELAASLVIQFGVLPMIFPLTSMSSKYLEGKPSSWPSGFCSKYVYRLQLRFLSRLLFVDIIEDSAKHGRLSVRPR